MHVWAPPSRALRKVLPRGRLKKVKVTGTQQAKTQGHGGNVLGKASSFQLAGQESQNKREPFTELRGQLEHQAMSKDMEAMEIV